jgi:thymidylate synthase (FAD)
MTNIFQRFINKFRKTPVLPPAKIDVLDHGYVRLVDHMGTDLSVTAAARVSYDKESTEWNEKEQRLLNFLLREGHTSTLRHAEISFEVYAPMMVVRQWYKHAVGSSHLEDGLAWNESSRRYITEEPVFYVPAADAWRSKPANSKQGSGPNLNTNEQGGTLLTQALNATIEQGLKAYESALTLGVAPEQARLFLPAAYGMYVRWRWTTSLAGVLQFLDQRLKHDSQYEIQLYAAAVKQLTEQLFPETVKAWDQS